MKSYVLAPTKIYEPLENDISKKGGHGSYPFNQAPLDPWSLYVERFPSAYNFK